MRVRRLPMILLAIFALILAACGGGTTAPEAPAGDTTDPATEESTDAAEAPEGEAEPADSSEAPAENADGRAPSTEGILTVSDQQQATWVRNFNPFAGDNRWPTQAGIYEPMFIYNIMAGEIEPWLATEWEWNEDNTVLTFTLREGVQWSDGEPFTADDVAYTFNAMVENEGLQGNGRAAILFLESIEALDETTAQFTFNEVSTVSMYDIGHQMIVPEHIWSEVEDPITFLNENPVATGPFTEITLFQDQVWQIEKNPNYWQEGKPYIQGLRQPAYPGNDQANLATINGENDLASNFIPNVEETYVSEDPENHNYWFPPINAPVMLYLNTTKAPFDDPNVRKAISMAFDRQQLATVAVFDYTIPSDATGLTAAHEDWKNPEAIEAGTWTEFNIEEANRLLDEAGLERGADGVRMLPDGTRMEYDINVVSGWTDWVSMNQIIAQGLTAVGIQATTRTYDFSAWFDQVQKGQFDMSMGWSNTGVTPYQFYRGMMYMESAERPIGELNGDNWHRFGTEEADALLLEFASTADLEEQKQIMNEIQMLFVENAPAIPLVPNVYWGANNTSRFTNFPNEENPYVLLSSFAQPDRLILLTNIQPQ